MDIELLGLQSVQSVEGAAATDDVDFRPLEGEMWIVQELYVEHDDPAGNNTTINYRNAAGTEDFPLWAVAALAQSTKTYMRKDGGVRGKVILTRYHYIRATFTGLAAGKKGYIKAVVAKFKGLPTDSGS